jgi:RecJ-like exonuclease
MTVFTITHGDDVDGLTCGAFLIRLMKSDVYLANYDNLEKALSKVRPPVDTLYICDLNIREALWPEIDRINEFAEITIIDHHQMEPNLQKKIIENDIKLIFDKTECAGVITFYHFKKELGREASRLAAYAAISDMFENGPLASKILARMDRKFAQHEAQILTHALAADQTIDFKQKIMHELSDFVYPHRIDGVVDATLRCLENMAKIIEMIPGKANVVGRVAYMEAGEESTGGLSNLIIESLGVDVALSYKENGDFVNVSLRGEKGLNEHLGELSKLTAKKHGGFGGGHHRASGAKIPKENLTSFIREIVDFLN